MKPRFWGPLPSRGSASPASRSNWQLYVTALVKQGGNLTTYPALYLWNQPPGENNHTPAWDVFEIPPVPPPQ